MKACNNRRKTNKYFWQTVKPDRSSNSLPYGWEECICTIALTCGVILNTAAVNRTEIEVTLCTFCFRLQYTAAVQPPRKSKLKLTHLDK